MATNFIYRLRTDKDVAFTGALAQNALATYNLVANGATSGVNGNCRTRLKAITLQSDQNLAWEIWLWGKDTFDETNMDADFVIGFWAFSAVMGFQIGGAGQYYYYVDGLDVPYEDMDFTGEYHLGLVNRSVTGKNAGATGEIVVELSLEIEGS